MPTISIPNGTATIAEQREGRDSTGKLWRWEVSPYCGTPWPVRKDGKPFSRLPGERSRFWEAVAMHGNAPCIDATTDTERKNQ